MPQFDPSTDDGVPLYRAGAPWSTSEDGALVQGLVDGLTVENLAETHGRTPTAIMSRLSRMVPEPDDPEAASTVTRVPVPAGPRKRVTWLRDHLSADPDYDWRSRLNETQSPAQRLWTSENDALLTQVWETEDNLAGVSSTLRVEEHVVVRRLVQLGLAANHVEATDRLRCSPGSVADVRRRLALNAASTRVLVLVLLADGELHHVSLHANEADAELLLAQLVNDLQQQGEHSEAQWTLGWRQVEARSQSTGPTQSGVIHLDGAG